MMAELRVLPLEQIDLGDRARRRYRNIGALADSIRRIGIVQPLAVMRQKVLGKPYRIVAGGRRHAAAKLIGLTEVPCLIYPQMPEELYRRLELEAEKEQEKLDWVEMEWLVREVRRMEALKGEEPDVH